MTNSYDWNADELEMRVKGRTAELEKANQTLHAEVLEYKSVENELIRIKDKLEVEIRDTRILHKLSTQHIENGNLSSIFREIVEAAIEITGADKGIIQILDPSEGKLRNAAHRGFDLPFLKSFESMDVEEAALFTPLISRSGEPLGIISVYFGHIHTPVERELILVDILARQAADIIDRKLAEETLRQSEQQIRLKMESVLSPALEIHNLDLAEIVDIQAIQSLMNDFSELTHIPIGLNDLKGNVLAGAGWQDICTGFHRIHPETCKHCIESDIKLSSDVVPGEFKLYKCKNNMWDVVTPIVVGGHHVGSIFSGQFFFDDEPLYYEFFRSQARKYGFNEEEYIAALEKVPRLSREAVDTGMSFLMKLANMISQLSYSNIKLSNSLAERNELLEVLRESEEKYRIVADNTYDWEFWLDPNGRFLYTSPSCERVTGYAAWEFIDNPDLLQEIIHLEDRQAFLQHMHDVQPSRHGDIEFRIVTKNGEIRWIHHLCQPLYDREGRYAGRRGSNRDITERKQAEETLRKSEERLKALVKNLESGVLLIDGGGKFAIYNLAFLQIFNISEQELEHMKIQDRLWNTWNVVDKDGIALRFESHPVQFARLNRKPVKNQVIGIRRYPNDEWIWTLASAEPLLNPDGSIDIIICTFTDITEQKEIEKALKKAHDTLEEKVKERTAKLEEAYNSLEENEKGLAEAQRMAHVGNWRWNIVAGELFWSDEVYRIFGLNPKEFRITYDSFLSYVHPDDRDYLIDAIKEGLKGSPCDVEYRIVLADGEERIVHTEVESIYCEENIPIQAKGIVQDITERKRAEKELNRVNRIRIKEIHHRIKNNLQVISSLLDLQAEKFQNKECIKDSEVLEAFEESQNRILSMSLIHEELYKGEGTCKLNFSAYVQKLADNLFRTYSINSENIRLLMDLEEDSFFDMDTAIPLGIIVNELVSNSLKHAFNKNQEGEIRIRLCREEKEEKNNEILESLFSLTISDNGKGIPENIELESLESLGLQLVFILVDQLDGEVETKREHGTEFRITFNVTERS